ncbi:MFS transporter [Vibrio breoganii]|uniref:MFS transporter n=1 Tax=Vibrio breoganii TaxID=553239 RepID=A0AAN0XYC7_9VIBR|nr:MFS transporter [Vibrio breoganii]ANO34771.1 MFS transporter [Vibrio breoganii]PMG77698.1 MFS transporter [Vibrio breoganii]PMK42205.1 MFS transporter [Vibrio breoganii]PMO36063.1 MFS transporter [Vibrio breoganii]PMO56453.1 MFS transporter [Vibrio breoganii]
MSLFAVPFVETTADTVLHVVAFVVLIGTVAAGLYGFWRFHELPISKAHKRDHNQVALITVLTWIGFLWHWVWVIAVFIAFVDLETSLTRIRDIWNAPVGAPAPSKSTKTEESEVC